jgi:2-polyprenyl-6-methoxyphenol hydroxylase-like FAD-dependent oxidoreductase
MLRTRCYLVRVLLTPSNVWLKTYHENLDQGQGGGMAIEDGAALGVLLSNIISKDEIPARLQLFQELRIERVSAMVIFSSVGQDESARIADIARKYVKGPLPRKYLQIFCLYG